MPYISKYKPVGSNTTYDLKDAEVRAQANWNTNNGVKNAAPVSFIEKIASAEGFTVQTNCRLPAGDYIISFDYTSTSSATPAFFNSTGALTKPLTAINGSGHKSLSFTVTSQDDIAGYYFYAITAAKFENIMIRPAFITDDTFEPYSLPNTKITPELIDLVDSGAKNLLEVTKTTIAALNNGTWSGNVFTPGGQTGLTLTINNDGSISASGAPSAGVYIALSASLNSILTVGTTYVLSGCTGGSSATYGIYSGTQGIWDSFDGGTEKVYDSSITVIYLYVRASVSVSGKTFYPMICTKAAWDISQKFVPYRPSYEETVEQVAENKNNILTVANQTIKYNVCSANSWSMTGTGASPKQIIDTIPIGTYRIIATVNRTDTTKAIQFRVGYTTEMSVGNRVDVLPAVETENYISNEFTLTSPAVCIDFWANTPSDVIQFAIIPKAIYDAGFTSYQPYAMSNAELTVAEKQNENNISKQQDSTAQGGNGYALVNGIRVYVSATAPTGDIPDGSIWIGG